MSREPITPERGDWIVYTPDAARVDRTTPKVLDGPWRYGKLEKKGVDGWTIVNAAGSETFVMDREIVNVKLTRGEAIDTVDKLTATQYQFIQERDALKPKFEQRIRDLLNA